LELYLVKNLDGKEQIFLQLMALNKKMIGHLEDQNGLNAWKENAKMFVKMLVCWI